MNYLCDREKSGISGKSDVMHTRRSGEGPPLRLPRHALIKLVADGKREEDSGGAENDADDGILEPFRHGDLLSLTLIVRAYLEKSKGVENCDLIGI